MRGPSQARGFLACGGLFAVARGVMVVVLGVGVGMIDAVVLG